MADVTWSGVIPVKVLAQAKSRLAALGTSARTRLALAMAQDTVAAVLECPVVTEVIIVTDDPHVRAAFQSTGTSSTTKRHPVTAIRRVVVVPDRPGTGLNPALRHGAARARFPVTEQHGLVALTADLPALRPGELALALAEAGRHPSAFFPDAAGTGTTLYAARHPGRFQPGFGPGSRIRHRAGGAVELAIPGIAGLRQDVDTPQDLAAAAALGLGPRTALAVAALPGPAG